MVDERVTRRVDDGELELGAWERQWRLWSGARQRLVTAALRSTGARLRTAAPLGRRWFG